MIARILHAPPKNGEVSEVPNLSCNVALPQGTTRHSDPAPRKLISSAYSVSTKVTIGPKDWEDNQAFDCFLPGEVQDFSSGLNGFHGLSSPSRISPIPNEVICRVSFRTNFGDISDNASGRRSPTNVSLSENLEQRFGERKKVLLVGAASPDRDRISTFLSTMRWACTTVSVEAEMLAAVEREPFDVVLLDLSRSGACTERTILGIREIRPSLSERILVVSRGNLNPQASELIERYDLACLPHERVFSQLCVMLENLYQKQGAYQSRSGKTRAARLLFDSFRFPSPAGVRTSTASGRHLTYKYDSTFIEMFLDRSLGSEQVSLVGQVLRATEREQGNPALPVVLVDQSGTLARTTTNDSGEFNLEFTPGENISLEIRLGERSWVSIPVGTIDWVKEQPPSKATGA